MATCRTEMDRSRNYNYQPASRAVVNYRLAAAVVDSGDGECDTVDDHVDLLDQIVPNSYLDIDWTVHPDWEEEKRRRTHCDNLRIAELGSGRQVVCRSSGNSLTERDNMCISELREGRRVVFRSSGISLEPRVWNNDICTFFPVTSEKEVQVDDIVFCSVQPHDRIFGHIVKHKWWQSTPSAESVHGQEYVYIISNIRGWENGWCNTKHIFGKLVDNRSDKDTPYILE